MKIRSFLFVAFLLLGGVSARAQDSVARFVRYGVFGSTSLNIHNPQTTPITFPCNCSANYLPANTFGWSVGALLELPIIDKLGLSLRTSYSQFGARLVGYSIERIVLRNNSTLMAFPINIHQSHTLELSPSVSIESHFTYRPLDMMVLYAGVQAFSSLTKQYNSSVRLLDTLALLPNGELVNLFLTTPDGQKTTYLERTAESDALRMLNIGLSVGVAYEIPLDSRNQWLCTLEAFYTHFLGSLLQAPNIWTLDHLRAGVSLRYAPFATVK